MIGNVKGSERDFAEKGRCKPLLGLLNSISLAKSPRCIRQLLIKQIKLLLAKHI